MARKEFFGLSERKFILMGKAFAGLILSWSRKEYLLLLRCQVSLLFWKALLSQIYLSPFVLVSLRSYVAGEGICYTF